MPKQLSRSGQAAGWMLAVGLCIVGVVGAAKRWPIGELCLFLGCGLVLAVILLLGRHLKTFRITVGPGGISLNGKLESKPEVLDFVQGAALRGAASIYAFVHSQLGTNPATQDVKIQLQDSVVSLVQTEAFKTAITSNEVAAAIKSGPPAERVLAFGLLSANPALGTVDLILQGISSSQSGNEQYWALRAAQAAWANLKPVERQRVKDAVKAANYISDDEDRKKLAAELLARACARM